MATADYGWAKLDLAGNRVIWNPSDTKHNEILLEGSHFHSIVPMATLVISSLCLLSFIAILMSVCAASCGRRNVSNLLPWQTVWVPVIFMIGYFASDIANRVFHELERKVSVGYIGINVVIGFFEVIADGLLMVYLQKHSPVSVGNAHYLDKLAMGLETVGYFIIVAASKGTQIWNVVVQNSADTGSESDGNRKTDGIRRMSLRIFHYLATAAAGMLLLFAICFAILAGRFLHDPSKTKTLRKHFSFAVIVLAGAFLVRNSVMFAFTLLYSLLNKTASLGVQLI